MWTHEDMARKVIAFFSNGCSVNLGIGMPTKIAELVPETLDLWIHSENGVLGVKGRPIKSEVSATLINAGKETVSVKSGSSFFDSSLSFGMIRGGHIDFAVLGGMEVDAEGSLANWMIPGKKVTGMGGAMDLVHGAKRVIVMMTHLAKDGSSKLVKKCTLPLTGMSVVDTVVTDLGVFKPEKGKFKIMELAPGVSRESLNMTDVTHV